MILCLYADTILIVITMFEEILKRNYYVRPENQPKNTTLDTQTIKQRERQRFRRFDKMLMFLCRRERSIDHYIRYTKGLQCSLNNSLNLA